MTNIKDIKGILASHKRELNQIFKVKTIGIFGSYVRGEAKPGSDLDVLVEYEESPGLFDFIKLKNYLSELLGMNVDLVMKSALKPNIGKEILKEVVSV
jgi:predicted nucleotidyltransferase